MIGIYAMYWEKPDLIYIGQSGNIENRWKDHLKEFIKGTHYNNKMQSAFNIYGNPEFIPIEEVPLAKLDYAEIQWIKEFDSFNSGANGTIGGRGIGSGVDSPSSKYSKITILKAFSLLYNTLLTLNTISKRANIGLGVLTHIANGTGHLWLQEEYPVQYKIMRSNIPLRAKHNKNSLAYTISRAKEYPPIEGPDGVTYRITNVTEFCGMHPLLGLTGLSNMHAVLRGERAQHKGFKLHNISNGFTKSCVVYPPIIDPDGVTYSDISNITNFCRAHSLLNNNPRTSSKGISSLFRGERSQYKGFKLT